MVPLPMRIQRSLKIAPGGKAIRLPSPKAPKRRPTGCVGPIPPRSQTQRHPVSMAADSGETTPALSDSQLIRSMNFEGVVALVVEDDEDARALTKRILMDVGATVVEAASAQSAMECVASSGANILISDIGMSNLDGYQLLRALRDAGHDESSLPAIALTAYSRMEDRAQALAAGFQEHLVKPLDPQLLIATVASLCSRHKA